MTAPIRLTLGDGERAAVDAAAALTGMPVADFCAHAAVAAAQQVAALHAPPPEPVPEPQRPVGAALRIRLTRPPAVFAP